MSKLKYTYLDYICAEFGFTKQDIESVPDSGISDDSVAEVCKKKYIQDQFKKFSDADLKDAANKLCDNPNPSTREEAIEFLVWVAILDLREEMDL